MSDLPTRLVQIGVGVDRKSHGVVSVTVTRLGDNERLLELSWREAEQLAGKLLEKALLASSLEVDVERIT